MAISDQVRSQLFQPAATSPSPQAKPQAIRIPTTRGGSSVGGLPRPPSSGRGLWTPEEHLRFLEALDKFPQGPWKCIAQYVGNKTPRQAMTHGQKYRQKIARRRRGLKKVVRDLQFAEQPQDQQAPPAEQPLLEEPETNPMGLSDQDFAAFVASLDLAEELQSEFLHAQSGESPLVLPIAAAPDFASYPLEADVPQAPASDCGLPPTTTQQDVHHWVAMDRADASSEVFSLALAEAFNAGNVQAEELAFARPLPLPEQLLDEYYQQQLELEPLMTAPEELEGLESIEFAAFELR
jgi:SHAQKYF class myb-like DNA-binding protein